MKATCHREGLLTAFQLANSALPAREVRPILRNFKAVVGDGRCTLMATDLEVGIRLDVLSLTIHESGEAILPAAKLLDILRAAQDSELEIEADENTCAVRGQTLEYELATEDPAHFPDIPIFTDDRYHEVPAGVLREMIRRTVFATADDSGRYTVTGVLWELEDDTIRLIATDLKRLAIVQGGGVAHGGHTTRGQTPIVPKKAMSLLERNLIDDGEVVRVCLRPNEALFRTELATIYCRLLEGRFPDYRTVLPKKTTVKIPLEVGSFTAAVRQAQIMTDEESKRVTFKFGPNKLTLQSGATAGRSKVELPISYNGKNIDINFNAALVLEMLKVLAPDADLQLELVDGNTAALFRSGPDYSYVVMPLT